MFLVVGILVAGGNPGVADDVQCVTPFRPQTYRARKRANRFRATVSCALRWACRYMGPQCTESAVFLRAAPQAQQWPGKMPGHVPITLVLS